MAFFKKKDVVNTHSNLIKFQFIESTGENDAQKYVHVY